MEERVWNSGNAKGSVMESGIRGENERRRRGSGRGPGKKAKVESVLFGI